MTQLELNDETLGAYLDNALDAATRSEIARRLASDSGARLRLERLRAADTRLAESLPLPGPDHFSEAMAARIRQGAGGSVAAPRARPRVLPWATAAALGGAIIGALLTRSLLPTAPIDAGVARLLQSAPSGTTSADGHARVVLTIRSPVAGICRVFEVDGAQGGDGLACRDADGWVLKAWDATPSQAGGFQTAGASALIDTAMDALQGSPALEATDEGNLIERDWR
jgi:hypothetical protein